MSVLTMNPSDLSPEGRTLFAEISARRKARGEGFGGPYIVLLNHLRGGSRRSGSF
jgi:hypothetical protein